jgi:hypothetical protein
MSKNLLRDRSALISSVMLYMKNNFIIVEPPLRMPATVSLPPLFGDEPRNQSTDRCKLIFETRNLYATTTNPDADRLSNNQQKSQNQVDIQTRTSVATVNSKNLEARLHILRLRLGVLKIKVAKILDDVFKIPPDPGPAVSASTHPIIDLEGHEDRKHPPPPTLPKKGELQVIRGSKLGHEEISYEFDEFAFKSSKNSIQILPKSFLQVQNLPTLPSRCSLICSMAEHPEQLMALEGDGMGGAHPVPIGSTKEVGENSKAEGKCVLVVDMTGARKPSQRFLAVSFFLSVLLVNSRQLIDHMKMVWKIRGEMDDSPLEAETGRKFVLVFSQEGDWNAILGRPWQYKGDTFLVEGLSWSPKASNRPTIARGGSGLEDLDRYPVRPHERTHLVWP